MPLDKSFLISIQFLYVPSPLYLVSSYITKTVMAAHTNSLKSALYNSTYILLPRERR